MQNHALVSRSRESGRGGESAHQQISVNKQRTSDGHCTMESGLVECPDS